jgi:hypothetical protein
MMAIPENGTLEDKLTDHPGAVAVGGRIPGQLAKLIRAGYVKRCDHPTVRHGKYPAEALAIHRTRTDGPAFGIGAAPIPLNSRGILTRSGGT